MNFREFGYISNILSVSRIILAIPIYYLLDLQTKTGNYLATAVMLLAALTDAYDGRLARKLNQKSDLGRVLDPVADKICMGIIFLILVQTRDMPLWFVIFVLGRDLAILVLGLFLAVKRENVVESNMWGKVTVNALALTVVSYVLEFNTAKLFFLWISVGFLIASSISYSIKFLKQP